MRRACLRAIDAWAARALTVEAMIRLLVARLLVALLPFGWWRNRLGGRPGDGVGDSRLVQRMAAHVERAGWRLAIRTACLPRAMALSWMLRRRRIEHVLAIAVRPQERRGEDDALHAWVCHGGEIMLGELPGPWHVVLRLGGDKDGQPGQSG